MRHRKEDPIAKARRAVRFWALFSISIYFTASVAEIGIAIRTHAWPSLVWFALAAFMAFNALWNATTHARFELDCWAEDFFQEADLSEGRV